ncbi:hypothetical protein FACS1894184_18260 [Clostridia bacterium]|nr:hypothetical protein FACS1894184_18260 [Clostridia bacterium]
MITRSPNMLAEGIVSERLLQGVLKEFRTSALTRMNRARDYYDGSHAIDKRTKPIGAPNNKVEASYPRYIVTLASGYLAGSPVQYASGEQETAALESVQQAYAGEPGADAAQRDD